MSKGIFDTLVSQIGNLGDGGFEFGKVHTLGHNTQNVRLFRVINNTAIV